VTNIAILHLADANTKRPTKYTHC